MDKPHDIQLVSGMYWCETENCDADECEDEDRCSNGCCCNAKIDFDMTESLSGKTIYEVWSGMVMGNWGAEPTTVLHFTDGTTKGFVHPADED
jgi:hypothetical protein